jgi:hypothetical protein
VSDEAPRDHDEVEVDEVDEDETGPTYLPDPADVPPVEADAADWIDQQRAVPDDEDAHDR